MLIILISIAIVAFFITISFFVDKYDRGPLVAWGISIGAVLLIIIMIVTGFSYGTYLDCRSFYDSTVEQYKGSISMYEDKALLKVNEDTFTDFKYNGYQENIAGFIKDLRNNVVLYNNTIIQKRKMNQSVAFDWLIISPDDDMKLISMK